MINIDPEEENLEELLIINSQKKISTQLIKNNQKLVHMTDTHNEISRQEILMIETNIHIDLLLKFRRMTKFSMSKNSRYFQMIQEMIRNKERGFMTLIIERNMTMLNIRTIFIRGITT